MLAKSISIAIGIATGLLGGNSFAILIIELFLQYFVSSLCTHGDLVAHCSVNCVITNNMKCPMLLQTYIIIVTVWFLK